MFTDQINDALVSLRHFFKLTDPNLLNGSVHFTVFKSDFTIKSEQKRQKKKSMGFAWA